jgi:hypothetical protein
MRSVVLAVTGIGILIAGPSHGACSKPEAPICGQQPGAFTGQADFDQCRMQMISYKSGMETFANCLQKEGQSAQEQSAREELDAVLARFNRRARGE